MPGPVAVVGPTGEGCQVVVHVQVDLGTSIGKQRLVEVPEANLSGQVGDHRMPLLGRSHQPVEAEAELLVESVGTGWWTFEQPFEHGDHERHLSRDPLL